MFTLANICYPCVHVPPTHTHVHTSMCMCACRCASMHREVSKKNQVFDVIVISFYLLICGTCMHVSVHMFLFPLRWITDTYCHAWLCMWVLGIELRCSCLFSKLFTS